MELSADIAQLLGTLRDGLLARGDLVGVYLYGSLATGDFSPARSDIDVVVMVAREPDTAAIQELTQLHMILASQGDAAGRLHCLYVPAESGPDPAHLHTYWHGNRMTQWQLKVLTQAELASAGGGAPRPMAAAWPQARPDRRRPSRRAPGDQRLLAPDRPPAEVLAARLVG